MVIGSTLLAQNLKWIIQNIFGNNLKKKKAIFLISDEQGTKNPFVW